MVVPARVDRAYIDRLIPYRGDVNLHKVNLSWILIIQSVTQANLAVQLNAIERLAVNRVFCYGQTRVLAH